jgi:hypothetical protein
MVKNASKTIPGKWAWFNLLIYLIMIHFCQAAAKLINYFTILLGGHPGMKAFCSDLYIKRPTLDFINFTAYNFLTPGRNIEKVHT